MNKVIKLKKQPKTSESDSIKQLNSKLNKLDKKIDNLYVRLDGHINKIDKVYFNDVCYNIPLSSNSNYSAIALESAWIFA